MRTLTVGPGSEFKTLKALPKILLDGDVIEVEPGIYHESKAWPKAGTFDNPVTVKAMEPLKTIFDGEGVSFAGTPRALFEVGTAGGSYIFQDFKYRNTHNGNNNASAVRVVAGMVRCYGVHARNCDIGVHSTNPEYMYIGESDICWNGRGSNSHNIYLSGGKTALVEKCRIEHTTGGINVKIRARYVSIKNSRICDSVDGEIHLCQGPQTLEPGADCLVENNFIRTLVSGRANRARVIAIGNEGETAGGDRVGTLILRGNTIQMRHTDNICVSLDSAKAGLLTENNVIEGSIKLLRIRYGSHAGNAGSGNVFKRGNESFVFAEFPEIFTAPYIPPPDTTPPAPVTGLRAEQAGPAGELGKPCPPEASIRLFWEPSSSPDIDYYEVSAPYGPFSMGAECFFVDRAGLYHGRSYTYAVTAVDTNGNRSTASAAISVIRI